MRAATKRGARCVLLITEAGETVGWFGARPGRHAIDDRHAVFVEYARSLADAAGDEDLAIGGPVENCISGALRNIAGPPGSHRHEPAAHAFADEIVGDTLESKSNPGRQPCTKTLTCRSRQPHIDRPLSDPGVTMDSCYLARKTCPDGSVDIPDRVVEVHRYALDDRFPGIDDHPASETRQGYRLVALVLLSIVRPHQERRQIGSKWMLLIGGV